MVFILLNSIKKQSSSTDDFLNVRTTADFLCSAYSVLIISNNLKICGLSDRAGEQTDGKHVMTKDAAMGLVSYVGTRENVQLNTPNHIPLLGEDGKLSHLP